MSKFKIGDKVKIRKDSKYYRGDESNPKDTRGEVKTVCSGNLGIEVMWDNGISNSYNDSDLELWRFTKADLLDGMRLLSREGMLAWVCGNKVMFQGGDYNYLSSYTESMVFNNVASPSRFDIMKVTDRDGTVLFEREEEPTELTIEEIAAKFGLPVERVRIKK